MLTMPIFAEQSHNAQIVLFLKIGRVLNKLTFTAETVYLELKQVLYLWIYELHIRCIAFIPLNSNSLNQKILATCKKLNIF